jgi:hypothetical protein
VQGLESLDQLLHLHSDHYSPDSLHCIPFFFIQLTPTGSN